MKIYLVRHGRAESRSNFSGEDLLRPLAASGVEQAEALAEQLASDPPTRILCGPSLRCQQTVEPLAVAHDVPVEVDDRLAKGESVARALELLPTWDDGPLLLCTHADIVTSMLRLLELVETDPPDCRKGSVWVLEGQGYTPTRAAYFEPVRSKRPKATAVLDVAEPRSTRAAVLDLGSTSFSLLIADVKRDGSITPVVREKVMLRLGAAIADAEIPKKMQQRALDVARDLREITDREKVQCFLPVATAALRDAPNGADVARRLGKVLGRPIRILSGQEEARVMFRAFQRRLELGPEPVLGLDLGGGSLELAVGSGQRVMHEVTLKLGAVRLHREFVSGDPMRKSEAKRIRNHVREAVRAEREAIASFSPQRAIATGGTMSALWRIAQEKRARRGPDEVETSFDLETLQALAGDLIAATHDERLRMRGMRKARADLLPTGAIILQTVAEELGLESLQICDWGLREGVLLDALAPE